MDTSFLYSQDITSEIPDIPKDSIISKTIHKDNATSIVLFGFASGQELSEHTASQPALLYFIRGHADVTLHEEKMIAGPGTFIHMQAHLPHSIYAKSEVFMLLIMVKDEAS